MDELTVLVAKFAMLCLVGAVALGALSLVLLGLRAVLRLFP